MNKNLLIIGGISIVAAVGVASYVLFNGFESNIDSNQNNTESTNQVDLSSDGDFVVKKYQNLLEKIKSSELKKKLLSSCNDQQKFNQELKNLEDQLKDLRDYKDGYAELLLKTKIANNNKPDKHPGVCARDYDGSIAVPGSWSVDLDGNQIPPASWPPDLDGGVVPPPGWPLDENGKPFPPGECPRDYDGSISLPGSWSVDLDGNQIPPASWPLDLDGNPIPPPGWPLDADAKPLPPGSAEMPSGYMPNDEEMKKIKESVNEDEFLKEINKLEQEIINLLNELKSICKENQSSNSCDKACKNYVNKCLTLVPNANQALFDDGYKSCLKECAKWSLQKIECISKASTCESFTDVCGL